MTAQLVFQVLCHSPKKKLLRVPSQKKIASCMWISAPKEKSSPCAKEIKFPCLSSLLLLHQFSAVEDPRQMHIYLTENSVTSLTTRSHNFLHYSAIIFSSLINAPSPNFQRISLWIFSHEKKASIHSHNSRVSTTKFSFQEFTFCMKLPSKEFSICSHIFRDSSMEIYKFKAIISIKLF